MSDIVLAFKKGKLLSGNGPLKEWAPDWINVDTLIHGELLISQPCSKTTACCYCRSSMSSAHRGKHWLSYYVTIWENWTCHVDDPIFIDDPKFSWFYASVPMRDAQACKRFLDGQLGKPLNYRGFLQLGLGWPRGCTLNTEAPSQQQSWFCSELFAAVLRDQGYVLFFNVDPCAVRPVDLYQIALTIPGSEELKHHPRLA